MNAEFRKGWYVLYVKSRHEKKVDALLNRHHFESYLPIVNKLKKWSDRKKLVSTPLFPSYVFVYINRKEDFSKTLTLDGICCFISFAGKFARVKDEEVRDIKLLLNGEYDNIEISHSLPKAGEIKTIQYGLLSGKECEVVKVNNKEKILVRVDSIQMHITATLPIEYLGPTKVSY